MLGEGIAICNGGYFKHRVEGFLPSAMEIADGVRASEFADMAPTTGALVVTPAGSSLITAQEFKGSAGISQMLECGPILVTDGVPLPRESKEVRAHRTFIASDGGKRWCLGVTEPIGLSELAALLMTPGLMNECPVHRALNLDGGPSTSMAWRDKNGKTSHAEQRGIVRNYVRVVPAKAASQP
jgi:exopolysaccharide biosynthesis protein